MDNLIITVAPTNMKWSKTDNPNMPETPEEIALDAIEAHREGAVIAHIHAKDEKGKPTFETKYFREIVERIRAETDMVIQLSTAGMTESYKEKLIPIRELRSEMASLNIKGTDEEIEYNAKFMRDHGIIPVIEAFDLEMIRKANAMIEYGWIEQPAHFELVFDLESISGKTLLDQLEELSRRVRALHQGSIWSRNRGADHQLALDAFTILLGGHVRVGMEDNLYFSPGRFALNSSEFVRRVKSLCQMFGRELATVEGAKKMLFSHH